MTNEADAHHPYDYKFNQAIADRRAQGYRVVVYDGPYKASALLMRVEDKTAWFWRILADHGSGEPRQKHFYLCTHELRVLGWSLIGFPDARKVARISTEASDGCIST